VAATDRAIVRSLSLARSTVGLTLQRATSAGLTDRVLEAML
jgi:hypothetical protein